MDNSNLVIDNETNMLSVPLDEYCNSLKGIYRMSNRVIFVQIPQFIFKSFNPEIAKKRGYYAFPPTGLQYLYESINRRGLEIRILDLNFEVLKKVVEENFNYENWLDLLKESLNEFQPSIVAVSCMYDSGIYALMRALEFLKGENRYVVITGGVIPTYEVESLIKKGLCHFTVQRQGEWKINFLLDKLSGENKGFPQTPGILFQYKGKYYETSGEDITPDIDTNLIDSYSDVHVEEYYRYGSLNPFSRIAGIYNTPFAAIQLGRGCRGICTFCSVRDFIGKKVHHRSVEKVIEEMEFLIKNRGVKHFEWLDDDLLFFKEDFERILETVISRKWDITWSANNGLIAMSIDEKLIKLMRDSGCIGFKIGIETGNPEMLKRIRKPGSLDAFRRVSRLFDKYPEIFVGGNFMLGFPGESFKQMLDSFRFFMELGLDWGAFTICQAIRGATAFNEFEDRFSSQMDSKGNNVRNFMPVRESVKGHIPTAKTVCKGLDVFKIDPESLPNEDLVKEIWFTFNMVGNFINNKNLGPGGKVDKFISWVEMAQAAYPAIPYMCLFLAVAYVIKEDKDKAKEYFDKVVIFGNTDYWQERFAAFGLNELVDKFPQSKVEAFKSIELLKKYVNMHD
jgi:radical SAM superfamily enzyme YgiQ (UPF0313 family)